MKLNYKLLVLLGIIFLTLLAGCRASEDVFPSSVLEVREAIRANRNEIDFNNYVRLQIKESELVYDQTTPQLKNNEIEFEKDDEACTIWYCWFITNIADEPISLNYARFVPPELSSIIITNVPIEPKREDVILKPGERIRVQCGRIMRHFDRLTADEKKLFNKWKDTLYIVLRINGKMAYVELSPKDFPFRETVPDET